MKAQDAKPGIVYIREVSRKTAGFNPRTGEPMTRFRWEAAVEGTPNSELNFDVVEEGNIIQAYTVNESDAVKFCKKNPSMSYAKAKTVDGYQIFQQTPVPEKKTLLK